MPLTKRKDGWYWGSKGPFDSKSKALAVARAAYAHGYKGESTQVSQVSNESANPAKNIQRKIYPLPDNFG